MKIKVEIELNIERYNKGYFINDAKTLNQLMGSTSVSSNLHIYNVKRLKLKNKLGWYVERGEIINRINQLTNRVDSIQDKLKFMTAVINYK